MQGIVYRLKWDTKAMKTQCKAIGDQTYFMVSELEPALHDTLRGLVYTEFEDGFAKAFPSDTAHLDLIYANFERDMPDLILQAAGVQPVPWEKCLLALLERLKGQNLNWWLVGSCALAVRGLPVNPHDVDLAVQDQGNVQMSALMLDTQVEPMSDSRGWIWDWFGRCFLHTRLEWVGDVNDQAEQNGPCDFGPTAQSRSEIIQWRGYTLKVPPLDLQLAVSERRGLKERADLIRAVL